MTPPRPTVLAPGELTAAETSSTEAQHRGPRP
ncbi:MAG: hypothetical protein QOD91_701, partial [Frankiales bacterium]|nr:hypothetical protein [Frankiales bacterium]